MGDPPQGKRWLGDVLIDADLNAPDIVEMARCMTRFDQQAWDTQTLIFRETQLHERAFRACGFWVEDASLIRSDAARHRRLSKTNTQNKHGHLAKAERLDRIALTIDRLVRQAYRKALLLPSPEDG